MHWKPMPVGSTAGGLATAHGQGSACRGNLAALKVIN